MLWSFVTNPRWEWGVVAQWFFAESIIRGLLETLKLTVLAGAVGFGLGLVLALMRLSKSSLISSVSWTFSWIFRSTPLLVQLLLWYNLGYLYESITLGIPLTDVTFVDARTSDLMTPMLAAILGLGLHQAAYAAELIRGGILSVDQGQLEAASALGIPARDRSLRIVLPQAMRAILPPAFNEIIGLVKGTSIVYVLAHAELFFTVQLIYGRTQQVLPMLLVATLWYVVITSALSVGQYYIERHFSKGALRTLPPTPLQSLRAGSPPPARRRSLGMSLRSHHPSPHRAHPPCSPPPRSAAIARFRPGITISSSDPDRGRVLARGDRGWSRSAASTSPSATSRCCAASTCGSSPARSP